MSKNVSILFLVNLVLSILFFGAEAVSATNTANTEQAEINLLGGGYNGNKVQLALAVRMQPGWHIYWREAGDTGFPITLDWTGSTNIDGIEFLWPAPKRLRQELQPNNFAESYIYSDAVTFPINLTAKNGSKPVDITLHVTYAICAEICIPGQADLSVNLQPEYKSLANQKAIEAAKKLVPHENGTYGLKIEAINKGVFEDSGKQFIEVTASSLKKPFKSADIFIEGGERFAFNNPTITVNGKIAKFIVPVTFLTDKKDFTESQIRVTIISDKDSVELAISGDNLGQTQTITASETNKYNLATLVIMIVFAFLGGLILNIMPCVLPILSIKILGIINHGGGSKSDVTGAFLLTALGIFTSFMLLAIFTISLKAAGEVVGWGFHFQEPYFIIFLVVILTLFAANLWGVFEIDFRYLFSFFNKKKIVKADATIVKVGGVQHFMSGVLATILATPCTAPFLGTAVGFSVTRGAFEIFLIFTAMAVGLALPYLVFSCFPLLITKLPKPGAWMVTVKKIMGMLVAITVVWLVWVLSNQLGQFAASILLLLSITKIVKLWSAKHFSIIRKFQIPLLMVVVILSFVIPIKFSNKGEVATMQVNNAIWQDFKPERIPQLVDAGKIVFVDVTADWCLTCKVNKLTVLSRDEIKDAFVKMGVVTMRADWTNRDVQIAKYIMKYKRVGIPFNIIYGPAAPEGIVLSELLSKKEVLEVLQRVSGAATIRR